MPNLFKISKNGKSSFLYGTCHINDANDTVCTLSAEAKLAFDQSAQVVLEMTQEDAIKCNEYLISRLEEWKKQAQKNNEPCYDYLNITQLKKIAELFHDELRNVQDSHLALFQIVETSPMFLCQKIILKQLANAGFSTNNPLDSQIARQAKSIEKPIASLDTPDDVAQRMLGFSFNYEEQVDYAKRVLSNLNQSAEETRKTFLNFIELYLSGDSEGIKKFNEITQDSPIEKAHSQYLIYDRDPVFVQAMHNYLELGDSFFLMGATHLPGVILLLEEAGYQIEPVQEGERLYRIESLENTNISLRKSNLLKNIKISADAEWCYFFGSPKNTFKLRNKSDLPVLLELIKEKEIPENLKIEIEIFSTFNKEELMILSSMLKEPNAPKAIQLQLYNNSSEADIEIISQIFKCQCSVEELKISFNPMENISEASLQCLIDALKMQKFTGKLSLSMRNNTWNSPLYSELEKLTATSGKHSFDC